MNTTTNSEEWLRIEALDLEARGVAHRADGKVVFAAGALPGEEVRVRITRSKAKWEQGEAVAWRRAAFTRVQPRCPHFGVCGGCSMQHIDPQAQVAFKQRTLEDDLWHLAQVRPQTMLRPLAGPSWGYRHRARLTVRLVHKKGGVLVGFHERGSTYVADMRSCAILPPHVSALLLPLRALIAGLSCPDRLPQIELAVGEAQTVFVLRHLEPLAAADLKALAVFGLEHDVQWWLQPGGPHTAAPLDPQDPPLAYALPEFGVRMPFKPTDFTQVNHRINQALVSRALRLLAPQANERVADWFCGLGNFTLPLATRAAQVLGVEGSEALVQRARDNAAANGLQRNTRFETRNLFDMDASALQQLGAFDKWLVDPPREGALALCKALVEARAAGLQAPARIVYVSCNPATLARDAGMLVHQGGYALKSAGVVNMFPHTSHIESIAVFERA
ncbi:23S rRNA (uracil(1939)-C(5))-methyltransferase RlmD [Thiomonas delicata]|uniref:23S rRNA (uracil(1939)-C(5))-methyltransferase RlmD n=1 Tax=Thiomonas delicata TaxID=364030 RepID=A0A238D6F1_THIDL|nr:23S rRNA (uracil(1939)-C(5))-methyltransferase RlmD [Thiomonas delicata]SBP88752.1 23S rRNA (Uracil-5-)-methyltransferase(23S rRNA(M-5-U1939)-methyltransferase) [Thiomonas delicata]